MRIISIEENIDIDYGTHELYMHEINSKYHLKAKSTFNGNVFTLMITDKLSDKIRKVMKQIAIAYVRNYKVFFIESEKSYDD